MSSVLHELTNRTCPDTNLPTSGENCFFCPDGIHWDAHRIGWAVSGACAVLTTLITLFTLTMHATHYQVPDAQRQVMRVLMMPCVYAIVSFFSYRYYQAYEYYVLAETAYEAITLSAFLMLLMELVNLNKHAEGIEDTLKEKDKRKLPFPFGCFRFRASKPYFWHTLSFSVMQYVVIRPLITIVGIICEYYDVLCPSTYSVHFAEVYLDAVDFVSISVALYGLIVFYVLCKDELKGRRPLNKFLAIKLIVFFTFYQGFLFSILQSHNVIRGSDFWTAANVADGLQALCTTIEMVVFSVYMGWAYSWTEFTNPARNSQRPTSIKTYFQAIWDTINFSDFALEIWLSCKFFFDYMRGKDGTRARPDEKSKFQRVFVDPLSGHEKSQGGLPMSYMAMAGEGATQEKRYDASSPPGLRMHESSGSAGPFAHQPGSSRPEAPYHRLAEASAPSAQADGYPNPPNVVVTPPAASAPTTTWAAQGQGAGSQYHPASQSRPYQLASDPTYSAPASAASPHSGPTAPTSPARAAPLPLPLPFPQSHRTPAPTNLRPSAPSPIPSFRPAQTATSAHSNAYSSTASGTSAYFTPAGSGYSTPMATDIHDTHEGNGAYVQWPEAQSTGGAMGDIHRASRYSTIKPGERDGIEGNPRLY